MQSSHFIRIILEIVKAWSSNILVGEISAYFEKNNHLTHGLNKESQGKLEKTLKWIKMKTQLIKVWKVLWELFLEENLQL